jgi:predicted RNA-binding Zn-ribbon protein involved in translation (DUF1610 family)
MALHNLNPNEMGRDVDWEGNNAAFTCPVCGKVSIVSAMLHGNGRQCPSCHKSTGKVSRKGGRDSDGTASIEW